jgi:tripartite-type tricarboxylate transporter receptor subunit TctC
MISKTEIPNRCGRRPCVRRTLIRFVALAALFVGLVPDRSTALPAWPDRPVRLVVTFPAGSANDAAARVLGDALGRRWGKPVVVENRTGAEGTLGVGAFVAAHDDHTLLYTVAGSVTVAPLLIDRLPYDADRDLVPIVPALSTILTVAVNAALPVRTLDDLVRLARDQPGRLTWSSGPTLPHFTFAAFLKRRSLDMTYVGYRDAAQPQADLGEGRIQVLVTSLQASASPVQTGKARFIAIANPVRATALADVPTAKEAGYPELTIDGVAGLFGWRGMPDGLRDRIGADVREVMTEPEVRRRLEATGQTVLGGTAAQFQAAIADQRARVGEIGKFIDLRAK